MNSVAFHDSEFDELFCVLILFTQKLDARVKRISVGQKFIIDRSKAVFVVLGDNFNPHGGDPSQHG